MKTNEFSLRRFLNSWLHKKKKKMLLWTHILKDFSFCCNKVDPVWNLNSGFHLEKRILQVMEESWQELLQISRYFYQQYFWDIAFNKAIFLQGINSDCGYMSSYSSQCSLEKHLCKKYLHRIFLCAAKSVHCHNAESWASFPDRM